MDNVRGNCQCKQEEIMLLVCGCVRPPSFHILVNLSGRMTVVPAGGGEGGQTTSAQ